MLRIFKDEDVLEVWKQNHTGKFALLNTYEICKWSGVSGPKIKEGDRQAPEGFYHVTPGLMNPNSSYHLSFNIGYPNTYDRANNRTGSFLMVHGACSSAGCYSMTDEQIEEIYAIAREAFKGGQKAFQVQAFPFRLTPQNMAKHVDSKNFEFWTMLKEGSDFFELTNQTPKVDVCEKRYVFNRNADEGTSFNSRTECPSTNMPRSLALAFNKKQDEDQKKFDSLLKQLQVSPFVKPEDRPKTVSASIKAKPTIGPLAIIAPAPPPPVVASPEAAGEAKLEAANGGVPAIQKDAVQSDPISGDAVKPETLPAEGDVIPVPQAAPSIADRTAIISQAEPQKIKPQIN